MHFTRANLTPMGLRLAGVASPARHHLDVRERACMGKRFSIKVARLVGTRFDD